MITAEFQKKDLESLVQSCEKLVYGILCNMNINDMGRLGIDPETLCEHLENFAGREYVVNMKLKEDMPLASWDKEFLQELVDKKSNE